MNGRQTVGGRRPVKNMELWKELDEVALHHIGSGLRLTMVMCIMRKQIRKETKKLKYRNHEIQKPLKKRRNSKLRRLKTVAT